MQVRSLQASGFMRYATPVHLDLPPAGLVIVTGVNGAGKSGVIEVVSYAGWGKTLRGTDPRVADVAGVAQIETGFGMRVARGWSGKGAKQLDVSLLGAAKQVEFESPTKAQDHLIEVLGPWETWRRSCAFSAADDLSFSTASDADRKRLLEGLLGLQRFDVALDRARADARAANQARAIAAAALAASEVRLESTRRHAETLAGLAAAAAPEVDLATIRHRQAALEAELTFKSIAKDDEWRALDARHRAAAQWLSEAKRLQEEVRALSTDPTCPTCGQDVRSSPHAADMVTDAKVKLAAHQLVKPGAVDTSVHDAALAAFNEVNGALHAARGALLAAGREVKRHAEAVAALKSAQMAAIEFETQVDVEAADLASIDRQIAHLGACDAALGTRGARAHMLSDALVGMECAANAWLDRVARVDAPLRLRLSPYTEKKTGGTADAISMEVDGAGGGKGYRAASGGERRRIDVAVMLALAEVAQQADGRVAPTTFFDEVFDALDAPGVAQVGAALEHLAQDRCVVVITHSVSLARALCADVRLTVRDGAFEVG